MVRGKPLAQVLRDVRVKQVAVRQRVYFLRREKVLGKANGLVIVLVPLRKQRGVFLEHVSQRNGNVLLFFLVLELAPRKTRNARFQGGDGLVNVCPRHQGLAGFRGGR